MATFNTSIAATEDDGIELVDDVTGWVNNPSFGQMGYNSINGRRHSGFRFDNITIDQGSTIDSAIITIYQQHAFTACTGTWYGWDVDDAGTFDNSGTVPSTATRTTASAAWQTDSNTSLHFVDHDVTSIVQEIINRGGWSSGNALNLFVIADTLASTGIDQWHDYSTTSAVVAEITVEYGGMGPTPSGEYSFLQNATDTSDTDVYTFSSQNLGDADSGRHIIVCVSARKAGDDTTCAVTVGGIAASQIAKTSAQNPGSNITGIYIAAVPTGTTGDVVVTFGASMVRCTIQMYRALGISATAYDSDTSTASDPTVNLDVPVGFAIGCGLTNNASSTVTWTGLSEDVDGQLESQINYTSASQEFASPESGRTMTIDFSTSSAAVGAFASWEYLSGGWTGKVIGVTDPDKVIGVSAANISTVMGI